MTLLDAASRATSEAYGNGLWLQSAFDPLTGQMTSRRSGPGGTLTVIYDAISNITSRSDVGSYTYHATKKHAVIGAGGNTYSYDANGNLKNRNGKSLTWRSYNLPSLINGVGYSASFSYTPDRQRWRQVSGYASGNETTIDVGGQLEKLSTPVRASTGSTASRRRRRRCQLWRRPSAALTVRPFGYHIDS